MSDAGAVGGSDPLPPPAWWADKFADEPDRGASAWQQLIAQKPWKEERLRRLEQPGREPRRGRWGRAGRGRRGESDEPESLPRDTVVGCRVDATDLEAIDLLVEAGVRSTRSDAAAWFIRQGIRANQALVDEVRGTVDEIRRLRERAQARARERGGDPPPPPAGPADEPPERGA